MKLKEYIDNLSVLISEMHQTPRFSKELIDFLKKIENDIKMDSDYSLVAKKLRKQIEQQILKFGDQDSVSYSISKSITP